MNDILSKLRERGIQRIEFEDLETKVSVNTYNFVDMFMGRMDEWEMKTNETYGSTTIFISDGFVQYNTYLGNSIDLQRFCELVGVKYGNQKKSV